MRIILRILFLFVLFSALVSAHYQDDKNGFERPPPDCYLTECVEEGTWIDCGYVHSENEKIPCVNPKAGYYRRRCCDN